MRIISGKYKGIRFNPPKNFPSRPTTDQAKEALFNMVNNWYYIEDLKILDLFSGTGNISLEFASRGAENITAVEKNSHVVRYCEKLMKKFEVTEVNLIRSDVFEFLNKHSQQYELIFADPPYDFSLEDFSKIQVIIASKSSKLLNYKLKSL